ncbi:unnamed protein product [Euphydryas editha]|uniref:Reverse transcriptase domain-containing protein n=1 Tax=Euphydryas editha TaxID=104508 RepID=A0AAU9U6I8_EUPED|nr:unnamed protein product [Euphydryas editha]
MNGENINILCLTEHWISISQSIFNFSGHQVASMFNREKAIRGGSLIIISKLFKYKERKDIVSLSVEQTIELACVELEHFIVVCVYRPPSGLYENFEKVLEEILLKLNNSNKVIVVCGDFNIDLLHNSNISLRFKSMLLSYNLHNLFTEPTRITATSATCIDNIFTNCKPYFKAIINKLSSDHCGQLASFSYSLNTNKNILKKTFVPISTTRMERFRGSIVAKLPYLSYTNDPNYLYNCLFKLVKTEFSTIFTSKTVNSGGLLTFGEWATPGIHKSRQRLYELYSTKAYNHNVSFASFVSAYSKMFRRVCSMAKSLYIKDKIRNAHNKIKMTWNIIACESGRVADRSFDFKLNINDNFVTSDREVASEFEKFFTDIPLSTTQSLNSSPVIAEFLLKENVKECNVIFTFKPVNPKDIIVSFRSLDVKKSADLWGLSVKVVSSIIDVVAPHLATIFNGCIEKGVFPDLMKHSKVIPIFKSGSTLDPNNFRPVSVLPTFSKIFEKIILGQMLSHFNAHNLLHKKQFGFTKGRSTADASVELIKNVFEAWERSQDALGIFCDLSKAFDCVHHETLIRKLHHYGIRNKALNLLNSYLSNRIQRVDVNGKRSPGAPLDMGVPQGSILGPFLFLIYINDLPFFVQDKHEIVLFADDTSLIFKVKRNLPMYDDVNDALSKVVYWFDSNNLLLNNKKTKLIKFTTPNVKLVDNGIELGGEMLKPVKSTKFLGIIIDSKLQWDLHIEGLASRLSSAAFAVKKIRLLTDVDTARVVYFSYFHSIMSYGILLWGNVATVNIIFVLQKRAIRAIYSLGPRVSLRDKFKEIKILTVASQYVYENVMYVHKNIHEFPRNCDMHSINTRNKHKLVMPVTRLRRVSNSFYGQCIRLYNRLPENVQKASIAKFKKIVKERLCTKGYYSINDFLEDSTPWE